MKRNKTRLRHKTEINPVRVARANTVHSKAEGLLKELQVRHAKLALRNKQLRRAQTELEGLRDAYVDLYEFAPVAYLTLSASGRIATINRAGAHLLGGERGNLLQQSFESFIAPDDRPRYREILDHVADQCERQTYALSLRRSDGCLVHGQLDCMPGMRGDISMIRLVITDLTERQKAEAEIASLAFYDPLTHLPNRRLLMDRLLQASHACHRTLKHGAILSLDLDSFKPLNDTQGHDAGDRVLQQTARRLTACVREVDTVGRLGGDEFVIVLEDLSEDAVQATMHVQNVGEKILKVLAAPYVLGGREFHTTGSMGVSLFSSVREPVETMLKRADLALYRAKAMGGGILQLYDSELEATFQARTLLEIDMRRGLEQHEFLLHYQPQVDDHQRVTGVEALVRWQHPARGLLRPAEFLSVAEEKGLLLALGHWVLEAACSQLAEWATMPEMAHLTLSVNISVAEFSHPDFAARILEILNRKGVNPEKLFLEVTESSMLRNIGDTTARMRMLKSYGVRFSLDGFGTGFSSLAYLKNLPLDQLKIPRSFVRNVLTDPADAAIVRTILTLGRGMNLSVIAQGVESHMQQDFLTEQGCRAYQGSLFGKPVPAAKLRLQKDRLDCRAAG